MAEEGREMSKKAIVLTLIGLLTLLARGQETPAAGTYTLRFAIDTARTRNPAARAAESDVLASALNVRKAVALGYLPRLELGFHSGLVPEARGDIFSSPDSQTDLDGLGIFTRFSLDVTQPLLTFGRAGAAVAAARETVEVEASRRDLFLEDLTLEVVKAYWGVLSALRSEDLARESGDRYEELLTEIEKRLGRDDSEVDDEDLFEAKSHEFEIEVVVQDSIEKKDLALRLFNVLLDRDPAATVSLTASAPPSFDADEELMQRMVRIAADSRPEIRGLAAAVRVLDAKVVLHKRQRWPVLYLAASFGYARAANRQNQTNPFVVDNFNYRNLGMALGLRWEPDLFVNQAEVRRAEAERKALDDRLSALKAMTALDVARAFAAARRNEALLEAARRSLAAAKSWLRLSQENWDTGLGDAYRLLRAYRSYFELRGAEVEREYAFNVSLAMLSRALGDVGLYVGWVNGGKVVLD